MVIQEDKKGIWLELPKDKDKIEEFIELINGGTIERLYVGKHYVSDPIIDLSFLRGISNVKSIKEVSFNSCVNLKMLYMFSNIESLTGSTVNDEIIDLAHFPKLTTLVTSTISAYKNLSVPKIEEFHGYEKNFYPERLEEMQELKSLIFYPAPKGFSFQKISKLKKLERISITQGSILELKGIKKFKSLTRLYIAYARNLEHIDELSMLPNLQSLWLDSCPKLTNIDEISKIKNLIVLSLINIKNCSLDFVRTLQKLRCLDLNNCGKLESIAFLNEMPNLQSIAFNYTNVLDGDLTPCMRLKFAHTIDKRHYNLKNDQLPHDYQYCISAYFGRLEP